MGVHYYLYVPLDPEKRTEMEGALQVDLSSLKPRRPVVERLRKELDELYSGYEGESSATNDGFEARYTKCVCRWEEEGRTVAEYDDLTFEFSQGEFEEINLVFLGRHLPDAHHSLCAFLDVLDRHFGDYRIFDTSMMEAYGRKELIEGSRMRTPSMGEYLAGFDFLGRGPELTENRGWSRRAGLAYRCARCGSMMPADTNDYFTCACGAMHLDRDMHRFGSSLGDDNILVYRMSSVPDP